MSAPVNQCMALVVYLGCRTPGNIGFSLSKGEILPSSRTDRGVLVSGHRLQLQHLPGTLAWDALYPKSPGFSSAHPWGGYKPLSTLSVHQYQLQTFLFLTNPSDHAQPFRGLDISVPTRYNLSWAVSVSPRMSLFLRGSVVLTLSFPCSPTVWLRFFFPAQRC